MVRGEWDWGWKLSGEKRVDARRVGLSGKIRGEWDWDWEESGEKRGGCERGSGEWKR